MKTILFFFLLFNGVTAELEIHSVSDADAGHYFCRAEPKYSQHQPTRTIILKELQVILKVKKEPTEQFSTSTCTTNTLLSVSLFIMCLFISSL